MKVLVTGGAGYIGSTICSALEDRNHNPIILDSLITGKKQFVNGRIFYKGDIADKNVLERIFKKYPDIRYVVHCAALRKVPESVERPYDYYSNNVCKSLELFRNLNDLGCKNIIYSSSASVYESVKGFRVTESSSVGPKSPYAKTKVMVETILKDFCRTYGMRGISFRYFNPIGADPKMRSGSHDKEPISLLGKLVQAARKNTVFEITGNKWNTRDGTGIRDYPHVWDLATAHVLVIERFSEVLKKAGRNDGYLTINLGMGEGVTVKEFVVAFEKVLGRKIKKKFSPPRPGDVAGAYADTNLARKLIDWKATLTLEEGILHALEWAKKWESAKK